MTTVLSITKDLRTLLLASVALFGSFAAHAGPQVTFYLTVPLGGVTSGHVLGLRIDHSVSIPDIRNLNPASPLTRRPLLDLQFGKNAALRLEVDRRLAWDMNTQEWHDITKPATVTLRVPTHQEPSTPAERAALAASVANPLSDQIWKQLVKSHAIEP